jgi:superfamily II DNA or RNA helicase
VKTIAAVVGAEIVLRDLSIRSIERLRLALSYPHPERAKALRMRLPTEGLPLRFECMTEWPDGSITVPRGAVEVVRHALAQDDIAVTFVDERSTGSPIGPLPQFDLRGYQLSGVLRLESKAQGMIVLPCGGGKTFLGVGAVARIARTAIVLVHTDDLLDQWVEDVREKLGLEPGVVNADRKELDRPVVVASVFSLAPLLEADPAIGRRFGIVVTDECHHVPAITLQRCIRHLPARYRLGLTATPERQDGHTKLVDWSFGPKLLVKTVQELVAGGFLLMPRFREVSTAFEFAMSPTDKHRLTKLHRALVADAARNQIIVDLAHWEAQAGETVLILSNRKPHCRKLGKMLADLGVAVRVVIGTTKKSERRESLDELRDGTVSVVVATSLANEGLNIQRLSRIIIAFPDRSVGWTIQRAGRLTRKWEGKDPLLYDVVDHHVPTLASRAGDRKRAYRSIGMEVDVQVALPGVER